MAANAAQDEHRLLVMLVIAIALLFTTSVLAEDMPRLTFASNHYGSMQIVSVGIDGSNLEQVTNEPDEATQPMWSPDGSKLAYVMGAAMKGKIKIVTADGSEPHFLLDDGGPQKTPQWSPDGKRIAFSMRAESTGNSFNIFVVNADGAGLKNITPGKNLSAVPAWSPDGKKIAHSGVRPGGHLGLWLVNADGSEPIELLGRDLWGFVFPCFSPDGKQIVYGMSEDRTHCQIRQINVNGEGDTALTDGPKLYSYAAWSPDGQYLAYVSNPGGAVGDLCVYDVLSGEHRVVLKEEVCVQSHRDSRPSWIPKRKEH